MEITTGMIVTTLERGCGKNGDGSTAFKDMQGAIFRVGDLKGSTDEKWTIEYVLVNGNMLNGRDRNVAIRDESGYRRGNNCI